MVFRIWIHIIMSDGKTYLNPFVHSSDDNAPIGVGDEHVGSPEELRQVGVVLEGGAMHLWMMWM